MPAQTSASTPFPSTFPQPGPVLDGAPTCIDAGDRQVEVLLSLRNPRLVLLGNVLSPDECAALTEAARPRLARSLTVHTPSGNEERNPHRTSDGMFFERGESALLRTIEARLSRLLHWPATHCEPLQVLHYRTGTQYEPHYDFFDPAEHGTPSLLQRGGQRLATLVIYLNTPEQGGGTIFPDLGLEVAPRQGNAVFFRYDQPHPGTRTLHGGAPVVAGEKWVATQWLRERKFE